MVNNVNGIPSSGYYYPISVPKAPTASNPFAQQSGTQSAQDTIADGISTMSPAVYQTYLTSNNAVTQANALYQSAVSSLKKPSTTTQTTAPASNTFTNDLSGSSVSEGMSQISSMFMTIMSSMVQLLLSLISALTSSESTDELTQKNNKIESPDPVDGANKTPQDNGLSNDYKAGQPVNWDKAPQGITQYKSEIQSAAEKTGVPESIIAGMIWAESRGQADASSTNVNGGTDAGLMQVNPGTYSGELAGKHGLPQADATPTDPATNILAGATYLEQQHTQFGSWDKALRAYNSGPDKVNSDLTNVGGVGDPDYVKNVTSFANALEAGSSLPG